MKFESDKSDFIYFDYVIFRIKVWERCWDKFVTGKKVNPYLAQGEQMFTPLQIANSDAPILQR
jgi:hypothetical protein